MTARAKGEGIMDQLSHEKIYVDGIPVYVTRPVRDTGKAVILYHGWSSSALSQRARALLFAVSGYTVYAPDALHHGERQPLSDYYTPSVYSLFWDTIEQNMKESEQLIRFVRKRGGRQIFLSGHSMGGMSVLGIAYVHAEELCGVVSFNGSGDWLLTHLFIQARFGVYMGEAEPRFSFIRDSSPLSHAEKLLQLPLFLTNGEADISIDKRAQLHFVQVLEGKKGAVTHTVYPLLGHFVTTNMMDDAITWMDEVSERNPR